MKKLIGIGLLTIAIALYIFNTDSKMSNQKINIGVVLPLSGAVSQYGKWIQNALNMAKDEINNQQKEKIQFIFEDDKANPKDAINAIQKLINKDHVKIVFGSWASSCVMAMSPIAEKNKILLFAEALSPNIKHAGEYIYRVQPDGSLYVNKLIEYFKSKKLNNLGVIYINNDFGIEQMKLIKKNIKIDYLTAYEAKTKDFKSIIENIKTKELKNIIILGYKETAYFYKQLHELGASQNISLFGSVPTENPEIINIAGENATNGIIYPHHFKGASFLMTEKEQHFINEYKKRFGYAPEGFAYLAYEAMKFIIYPALIKGEMNTDKIKEVLDNDLFIGLSSKLKFDKFGDIQREVYLKMIKNKTFILMENQ